jgi:hypothetical protein
MTTVEDFSHTKEKKRGPRVRSRMRLAPPIGSVATDSFESDPATSNPNFNSLAVDSLPKPPSSLPTELDFQKWAIWGEQDVEPVVSAVPEPSPDMGMLVFPLIPDRYQ